ncbi:three-finger toxin 3-like [Megalobrama amblycephala]|uniref:three-finger toxin 3-like n=1 Tax=Megalobrama amblycephala TaxID=75352 RepID=UPI0020144106|nr:three-finger toxin 3-like [Megalobrama amblycephala]
MDLRISVVLLFVFLTGGYSLRCYTCLADWSGYCAAKMQTCPDGSTHCIKTEHRKYNPNGGYSVRSVTKSCAYSCIRYSGGSDKVYCCDTDLCNAADGVYKGSFLLLFSPLLSYFLFQ